MLWYLVSEEIVEEEARAREYPVMRVMNEGMGS